MKRVKRREKVKRGKREHEKSGGKERGGGREQRRGMVTKIKEEKRMENRKVVRRKMKKV